MTDCESVLSKDFILSYMSKLANVFNDTNINALDAFACRLDKIWKSGSTLFLCGNGGSAANAIHMANDFNYGIGCSPKTALSKPGLYADALSSNTAILTCLGNDIGYENIYSQQLEVKAKPSDLLLVLSGSGNSPNIIHAVQTAKNLGLTTFGILGFDGGRAKYLLDHPIHFHVHDMQISEDLQLICGHICMQRLNQMLIQN